MFTDDNTEGFTTEQLNEMNEEVNNLMMNYEEAYGEYEPYLQWAEEKVLKKWRGA